MRSPTPSFEGQQSRIIDNDRKIDRENQNPI